MMLDELKRQIKAYKMAKACISRLKVDWVGLCPLVIRDMKMAILHSCFEYYNLHHIPNWIWFTYIGIYDGD